MMSNDITRRGRRASPCGLRLARNRAGRHAPSLARAAGRERFVHLMADKTKRPAGITPPANSGGSEMYTHLLFLLIIVVILSLKVKIRINIDKQ